MKQLLSSRQKEVLGWMALGKTNAEIGRILGVSGATVKDHARNILVKLSVTNRTCAIVEGIRRGIIILEPAIQAAERLEPMPAVAVELPKIDSWPIFQLEGLIVYANLKADVGLSNPRHEFIQDRTFALLKFLADPLGWLHTRQAILDAVWGRNTFVEERTVDVNVVRLRKLLNGCPYAVKNERHIGYHLVHL